MNKIYLKGVKAYGYVGFLPEEKILGQWFEVDAVIWTDFSKAEKSDAITDTLDYRWCIKEIENLIQTAKFDLIERLAGAIADKLMEHPQIAKLQLIVIKHPPIPNFLGAVAVEVYRDRNAHLD
ncbi:MAG: dihydroneopterin aldolase [Pseudanabaenaceae cyanobacterium]